MTLNKYAFLRYVKHVGRRNKAKFDGLYIKAWFHDVLADFYWMIHKATNNTSI